MRNLEASVKKLFENRDWREILPKSFSWLETIKIEATPSVVAGAHHLVPVQADKNDPAGFKIPTTQIDAALKDQIFTSAKLHAWHGTGGALTIDVNHYLFTLVPMSGVKTTKVQISRQVGLDYAAHIKGRPISQVVICGEGEICSLEVFEGLAQGLFVCHAFKGQGEVEDKGDGFPGKIAVLGPSLDSNSVAHCLAMAKASAFTRALQDAPPNVLDSVHFGKIAEEMSAEFGLKCDLKGREEIREMGMGAFDSVASGTLVDPRLITIEIKGKDQSRTIALVGKGLTFDAGGISIKPSAGMHEMKYDMSGGAAVLGAAMYLSMVTPPTNVVCVIGAVENMPGMAATRPGDVATLTGAVLFGLGTIGSAMMTNDQDSGDFVLSMSREVGEPFWQLPLWPELDKEIRSDVADYKNIASASIKAGTIVGGVFLREFVKDCRWVHLDIAGTGWNCKAVGYPQNGGSGFGLRTLAKICMTADRPNGPRA
jgi:leucyl aminopeptidase